MHKKMTVRKSVIPDNKLIEVLQGAQEREIVWLIQLFNYILKIKRMPDGWRTNIHCINI